MIPFLPGEPAWSETEAALLREFIQKPVGQLFLRTLFFRRPLVTEKRDRETRNIQSDALVGYDECFGEIMNLAEGKPLSAADRAAQTRS